MGQDVRLEVVIKGRVQGVGFRHFVLVRARELGVMGFVRNRPDRAIEVVAEGERSRLDQLVSYLQVGPRAAWVTDFEQRWLTAAGTFDSFEVRF